MLGSSSFLLFTLVTWASVACSASKRVTQHDAPWNLARISHEKPDSNTYLYNSSAGEGVCVYILDSGVDEENAVRIQRAWSPREYLF